MKKCSDLKTGDIVFYSNEEGEAFFGKLEITDDHKDEQGNYTEADLHFTFGGSVSPVCLEDCEKVSTSLYDYAVHLEGLYMGLARLVEEKMPMKWIEQ